MFDPHGSGPDPGWAERTAAEVSRRLCGVLRRQRGRSARDAAELTAEAVQEAFLRGQEKWPGFPDGFANDLHRIRWLVKVAYRYALDQLQRRQRREAAEVSDQLPAPPVRRDHAAVWDALQSLDPEDRQIVLAAYYDDQTDAQVGRTLYPGGGSDGAVGQKARKRRLRAIALLRVALIRRDLDLEE